MDWSGILSHDFNATQNSQLLSINFRNFCTVQYLEPGGVPYMDRKICESSFTRTWNHAIWIIKEEVIVETMTESQSGRKRGVILVRLGEEDLSGLDLASEYKMEELRKT